LVEGEKRSEGIAGTLTERRKKLIYQNPGAEKAELNT